MYSFLSLCVVAMSRLVVIKSTRLLLLILVLVNPNVVRVS